MLLAGDLNTDFQHNTRFVVTVRNFIEELGLTVFWQNPDNTVGHVIQPVIHTHTHVNRGVASFSTLDNFVSDDNVFNADVDVVVGDAFYIVVGDVKVVNVVFGAAMLSVQLQAQSYQGFLE